MSGEQDRDAEEGDVAPEGAPQDSQAQPEPAVDAQAGEAQAEPGAPEQPEPAADARAGEAQAEPGAPEQPEPAADARAGEAQAEPGAPEQPEPAADAEPDDAQPTASAGSAATRGPARARRGRRGDRDPDLPAPVVRAQARYVRSSARKARLVCDHIRGKSVPEARAILATSPRSVARAWSKLLESAVANAEHNHELVGEDLYVKAVHADEGPTIKRFRPRAMGRATKIRKRTSHLTILLTPKE